MILKQTMSQIENSVTFVNNIQKKTSYLYDLYKADSLNENILGYSIMPLRRLLRYFEAIARDLMLCIKLNLVPFCVNASREYFSGSTKCPHRRQDFHNKFLIELGKVGVEGADSERLLKLIFNYEI